MRIIIIAALAILAIWVLVGSLIGKRRNGVPWLIIFALLIPAGVVTWFEVRWQQEQQHISETVVAAISGNPDARLECQRLTFAFADAESSEYFFDAGENVIGMKYSQCAQILEYFRDTTEPKPDPTLDQIKAMNLLSTEAVRLSGDETNELRLECLGNRNLGLVVAALGGTEKQGNLAAYTYQQEVLNKDGMFAKMQCFRA